MSTFYKPINRAKAVLTSPHVVGDGQFVVDNASIFGSPSAASPIKVSVTVGGMDSHFKITGISGNTLTINSAVEGTSDVNVPSGSTIDIRITASDISLLQDAIPKDILTLQETGGRHVDLSVDSTDTWFSTVIGTPGGTSYSVGVSTNSWVSVPHNTAYKPTTSMTGSFWIKIANGHAISTTSIFSTSTAGGGLTSGFCVELYFSGLYIDLSIGTGNTQTYLGSVADGVWHHIAFTYSTSTNTVYYYKDGSLVTQLAQTGNINQDTLPFLMAGLTGDTTCHMKDMRIYNIALSNTQVLSLSNGGDVRTGIVAQWTCNDGFGNTLTDMVGGYNGSCSSMTWSTDVPSQNPGPPTPQQQPASILHMAPGVRGDQRGVLNIGDTRTGVSIHTNSFDIRSGVTDTVLVSIDPVSTSSSLQISSTNISTATIAIKALSGQTANLQEWQSSTGTALLAVDQNGNFIASTSYSFNITTTNGATVFTAGTNGTQALLGFYGATAVARPVLSYSRSGSGETAALAAVRGALASLGLVTDNTVA